MANIGKVKFQPPNVPVIFVLGLTTRETRTRSCLINWLFPGGPGSGKVTHCDTLMQEKRGVTHINMMDLLQQYAIGNGKFSVTAIIISTATYIYLLFACASLVDERPKRFYWFPILGFELLNDVRGHNTAAKKSFTDKLLIRVKMCCCSVLSPCRW